MKISMSADFKILKRNDAGEFMPLSKCQAEAVSIGGFDFCIDGHNVPFYWDAFTGSEGDGVFRFYTGKGFMFNDYELADYYDEQYKKMGFERADLSAEFLASVDHIEEFSVSFQDFLPFEDDFNDVDLGCFSCNAIPDATYKLELVAISFKDMETEKVYDVDSRVLVAFNRGEREIVVSRGEMDQLVARGEKRLRSQAKEAFADLDSKISFCEALAGEQKNTSVGSVDRDER